MRKPNAFRRRGALMMGLVPPMGVSAMPVAGEFGQDLLLARKYHVPSFWRGTKAVGREADY